MKKKVVIIGGGFGGITAAKYLKHSDAEIILIDKTNHHLFQPLLYQVATSALSPGDIAAPIRAIFHRQMNVRVIMGEVININVNKRKIFLRNDEFNYDYLIIAIGSHHSYFGNENWEKFAPGLKTLSDALNIREKVLLSFEKAERCKDKDEEAKYITFVIVGGGPTGVEIAGAISEISKKTMLKDFRKIDPSKTKIILVEAQERILTSFDSDLSLKASDALSKLGVEVRLKTKVTDINENGVKLENEFIETTNIIWAAGNKIPTLIDCLDVGKDRSGRVIVNSDCSINGHHEVFVIGDAAQFLENEKPLPGVAPVAIQQGKYVAKIISKEIPFEKRKPFKYFDKGNLATIGKAKAVMQIGKIKVSGFVAWVAWVFIHILYLIGFRNRYKVMTEWIWYYITNKQGVRLITKQTDL